MKLKDYVKAIGKIMELEDVYGVTVEVGLDTDMTVNEMSPNRITFSFKRKEE